MRGGIPACVLGLLAAVLGCRAEAPPSHGPGVVIPPTPAAPSGGASATPAPPARSAEPPAGTESQAGELLLGTDECEHDSDCVPSACCHATGCVAQRRAPKCDGAMCTMDCRGDTLDCGGRCLCHDGVCAAQLAPARRFRSPLPTR